MRNARQQHRLNVLHIIMMCDLGGRFYDAECGPELPTCLVEQYD